MTYHFGLDIGGTKIAGAAFSSEGRKLAEVVEPTPRDYDSFLQICLNVIRCLEKQTGEQGTVGIGVAGRMDSAKGFNDPSPSLAFMRGHSFHQDMQSLMGRSVRVANDANCMALAEALEGAGKDFESVLGLIIGTGVGSGFVYRKMLITGANGLAGEIGHLPLPWREEADGPMALCGCGQTGCIDESINGQALGRLYKLMTGASSDAETIGKQAETGQTEALRVLDRYYRVVAKAMLAAIHSFDPDIIVLGGGLSGLPHFCDEVRKRWGQYAYVPTVTTRLALAHFGPMSGLRGAALIGAGLG